MSRIGRVVGAAVASAVLAATAVGVAPAAWSHGYVGGGASDLVARAALSANTGLGAAQWEPQSIEGRKGFPAAGPADGQIASGGNTRFAALDEQSADRWVKNEISVGANTVAWRYTAKHRTTQWDYFMTTPGWDPDSPLARASFEKIATVTHDGSLPADGAAHVLDIPADRVGYHVVLAVWVVDDTANAFYNVIDVDVQGDADEPADPVGPPMMTGEPVATEVTGAHVALSWPAAEGGAGVAGYEVHRDGVQVARTASTTWTDRDVRPATSYRYTVRAYDRAGAVSDPSAEVLVTTPDGPVALTPPTGLHSMGTTSSGVGLMWTAATGGSGDVVHAVLRATGDGAFTEVGRTAGTRFQDAGLTPATSYRYVVVAHDASGATARGAELRVTTAADQTATPAWSAVGTYAVGDRVVHQGRTYECIQAYRGYGDPNWILAPSLWRVVR